MGRLDEALAALETGLMFEPENAVSTVPFKRICSNLGSQRTLPKELKTTMQIIQEQLRTQKSTAETPANDDGQQKEEVEVQSS